MKLQWALLGACLALTGCHVSPPSAPTAAQPSDPESEPGIVCSRAEGVGIARVLLRGEQDRAVCSSLRSIAGKPEDARVVEGDIARMHIAGKQAGEGAFDQRFHARFETRETAIHASDYTRPAIMPGPGR